jgi:hypothetical protein
LKKLEIEGLVRIKKAAQAKMKFSASSEEKKLMELVFLKGTRVCQCCHQGIFVLGEKGRRPKKINTNVNGGLLLGWNTK